MYTAARNPVNRNGHFQRALEIDCGTRGISEILQPRHPTTFSTFLDRIVSRFAQKN